MICYVYSPEYGYLKEVADNGSGGSIWVTMPARATTFGTIEAAQKACDSLQRGIVAHVEPVNPGPTAEEFFRVFTAG